MKTFLDLPDTATKSVRYPSSRMVTRSQYQRAACDLHRQGLSPRDIGAALRIGTEAAAQLLEPTRAS
jgi:hypothetical protein